MKLYSNNSTKLDKKKINKCKMVKALKKWQKRRKSKKKKDHAREVDLQEVTVEGAHILQIQEMVEGTRDLTEVKINIENVNGIILQVRATNTDAIKQEMIDLLEGKDPLPQKIKSLKEKIQQIKKSNKCQKWCLNK